MDTELNSQKKESRIKVPITRRSALFGLPRALEVVRLFSNERTRTQIGRVARGRGGSQFWQLLLEAIDAGFVVPNADQYQRDRIPLRLLFTKIPAQPLGGSPGSDRRFFYRYELTNSKHREFVCNVIMPAALANKERVSQDPKCLESVVNDYLREAETRRAVAVKAEELPADEYPAIMYGVPLWPRPSHATYSYTQCRAACRYFEDLLKLCDQSVALISPKSKAMAIRFSTRAIRRFTDTEVLRLTDTIATAMENNPEGECDPPPMPHDHKW